jgi:hypothetical protein
MRRHLAAAALALAACGKPSAEPAFAFAAVPGMACADGSATGIGVSRGTSDVLLFLDGGGACWDACHCEASPGPFGPEQLALGQAGALAGTILDRTLAGNPFVRFTMVFVPYCTGDVHAGDAVQAYPAMGATCAATGTWRHHGHRNLGAALAWVDANLPRPTRIVVAGSSAGGFGSLLAYDLVRARWPDGSIPPVTAALLDDSGPTFEPATVDTPGLSPTLTSAWWDSWGLDSTVTPVCPTCSGDLSTIWSTLSARYPSDRFALLSTTNDPTIEGFFELLPQDFGTALGALAADLDAPPKMASFRSATPGHALLASPATYRAGTTPLLSWLDPIAVGTGAFVSAGP